MSTESWIIIGISAAALLVSVVSVYLGGKWHKVSTRRHLEDELYRIEDTVRDIDVQIEIEKSAGFEEASRVYGMTSSHPHIAEITALLERKEALEKRKAEIQNELKKIKP